MTFSATNPNAAAIVNARGQGQDAIRGVRQYNLSSKASKRRIMWRVLCPPRHRCSRKVAAPIGGFRLVRNTVRSRAGKLSLPSPFGDARLEPQPVRNPEHRRLHRDPQIGAADNHPMTRSLRSPPSNPAKSLKARLGNCGECKGNDD